MKRLLICILMASSLFPLCCALAQTPQSPLTIQNPVTVRVEPVGPLKLDNGPGAPSWSYWTPLIGPFVSSIFAIGGVWLGLLVGQGNTRRTIEAAQRNSDAAIWQKANETELRDIQAKLDGFYIPFQLMSKANHQFAQDLREREGKDYRMLIRLFDKQWRANLSDGDRKIVEVVCSNAEELRALISNKSGLVDDSVLPYLSRASAHFRILNLAYKSELGTDPGRFKDYVYPRQLDAVLALEVARLRERIEQLRANPGGRPALLAPLAIPREMQLPEWADPDGRLQGRAPS